jgi:hypothetical protein
MDWKVIWHTHKVFIRNVGIGAAVYLVLLTYTQSLAADAQKLSVKNTRMDQKLRQTEQGLKTVEGAEKGRSEALSQDLEPKILGRLLWNLSSKRRVKKDAKNRYLSFTEKRRETTLAISAAAQARNTRVPKKFGFLAESKEGLVDEHCFRLDITERLLVLLLESGVQSIDRVEQKKPLYEKLPFGEEKPRYLCQIPVRLDCTIAPRTFPKILAEFQKPGQFLEVTEFRQQRDGRSKSGLIKLTMTISAMLVTDKVGDGSKVRKGGGKGTRPSRFGGSRFKRFGRRR